MERIEELLQLSESGQREHLSALLPALSNWHAKTEAKATVDAVVLRGAVAEKASQPRLQ